MKALLPLGITSLVLGFLLGVLVDFPMASAGAVRQSGDGTVFEDVPEGFRGEEAEELGDQFSSAYTVVIEDLLSFQRDPDYARAEQRREQLIVYADGLIPRFQDFADRMTAKLRDLLAEAATLEGSMGEEASPSDAAQP